MNSFDFRSGTYGRKDQIQWNFKDLAKAYFYSVFYNEHSFLYHKVCFPLRDEQIRFCFDNLRCLNPKL